MAATDTRAASAKAHSTGLRLPAALHRDLRAVAARNDRSMNAEARRAIAEHVRRELDRQEDA